MVAPSWERFQRPQQRMINEEENELKKEIPGGINDQQKTEGQKPQWGNFQTPTTYQGPVDPTAEESSISYLARNIASNASRIGELIAGRYGNLEKVGKSILSDLPQTGGILGWALSELVGPERWERMVKGAPGQQQTLPTSEQLKELSIKGTKGYTAPKTEGEKKFQNVVEDIGSTISGGRAATARNVAINNLGIPVAANAVENIVEHLGFGKDKATTAKLGTWLALSLAGNVNAPNYASDLMNQGRNGIPNNLQSNVPRFQQRLQQVANDPHLLHADPRSALARQELAAIERDVAAGQTSVRSLMTSYDGINAAKRNRDLFSLNRNDQAFARRAIDRVRNAVRDEIMDSGAAYPDALNSWRSGIQAWSVIHQSNAITNWVENLANGRYAKLLSGPAAGLFGVGSYAAFKAPLIAGPTATAIPGGYKAYQTAYRVWNDPNLARYYWNAIGNAQRENLPAFLNNYLKLDKGLKKSEPAKVKSKSEKK